MNKIPNNSRFAFVWEQPEDSTQSFEIEIVIRSSGESVEKPQVQPEPRRGQSGNAKWKTRRRPVAF